MPRQIYIDQNAAWGSIDHHFICFYIAMEGSGNAAAVQQHIDQGVDIDVYEYRSCGPVTPLRYAVECSNHDAVGVLCKKIKSEPKLKSLLSFDAEPLTVVACKN